MKISRTEIEYIDNTLGRLYGGLSLLVTSDSFTLNDANRLAALIALKFLEKGGAVIMVHTNLPFEIINRQIKENFCEKMNTAFQKAIREDRFYFLDLVSSENKTIVYNEVKNIREIANEPNRIIYEISEAKSRLKQKFPDTPILVIYANISSSIIDFDSKTVLRMIRKLTLDAKGEGGIFLGIANRDVHEPQVTNTLTHIIDYAINFSFETVEEKKQSYVHISRTPLIREAHKILNQRFAYLFTPDKFITLFPLYDSFTKLKESMSFNELGQVSILGWNHIITPIQTLILFIKAIEKQHNQEESRKILLELGEQVGRGAALLIKSESQKNNKDQLSEVLKYNTASGWGRVISIEGSVDTGKLKITGISTIALSYTHSDRPVCTFVAGALVGILQVVTNKEWICKETKCMAMGNDYCEFELETK
ncbi:MAG: 4-vinyl reductase [Candidatus Freyarchaeota archaeon]|nr:4-vinyl reductase [Candidatus Jordarchaeia archaeon]MBS7268304.1 4-vinyl reductase [Candidatus Jordarchaeia archaeon]MBS7278303.1 4-vinyl reductase [Candidatus Jordarchaeia archaeon]